MKKDENLSMYVNDFIEERLNVSYQKLLSDTKNRKVICNYREVFNKVQDCIKNSQLIEELKKAQFEYYSIQLIEAYKIAFKDSILIFK